MAIFKHTKSGGIEDAEVNLPGNPMAFPMYQQDNEDAVYAALNDMVQMDGLYPITFPGPDGQSVPRDDGKLVIAWRRIGGHLYFGVSTT